MESTTPQNRNSKSKSRTRKRKRPLLPTPKLQGPQDNNKPSRLPGTRSRNAKAAPLLPTPKFSTPKKQGFVKLTPYQGNKRCFGFFRCQNCNRPWQSGYSWANKGQQCQRCEIMVYPYKQEKLKKDDVAKDSEKPHDTMRCEKCQSIGFNCQELG